MRLYKDLWSSLAIHHQFVLRSARRSFSSLLLCAPTAINVALCYRRCNYRCFNLHLHHLHANQLYPYTAESTKQRHHHKHHSHHVSHSRHITNKHIGFPHAQVGRQHVQVCPPPGQDHSPSVQHQGPLQPWLARLLSHLFLFRLLRRPFQQLRLAARAERGPRQGQLGLPYTPAPRL